MADVNLNRPTAIYGRTTFGAVNTTATQIVTNAVSSSKILRVNTLYISNVDGTNACDVSLLIYSAAALGGTGYHIGKTINVPADSTLLIIGKDGPLYIEENKSLGVIAAVVSDLEFVCSYEEIT